MTSDESSSDDEKISIDVDGLTIALTIGAILYIWCLFLVRDKLGALHRKNPDLSLHKLLLLSTGLVCAVRVMSFIGVAGLNIANVAAHYSLNSGDNLDSEDEDENQEFYDAAMTVLFDLPNCIVASTYVLFALVWAECFVHSRLHIDSRIKWKRGILWAYVVFNLLLYSSQTTLYCLVFWPTKNTEEIFRTILYIFVTITNFSLVLMMGCLFVFLTFHFSGFPYRSEGERIALNKISYAMLLWTIARVAWAVSFLLVYINNTELLEDSDTPWTSFVLLSLYLLCEIIPIHFMLKTTKYIARLDVEDGKRRLMMQNDSSQSGTYEAPTHSDNTGYIFGSDSNVASNTIGSEDYLSSVHSRDTAFVSEYTI